jgi:steroid 5-alpha reductase family enzyme
LTYNALRYLLTISRNANYLGEAMRKLMIFLFAIAIVTFVASGAASAAPFSGAICKAAGKASLVSKVHCRIVRRCGYFGCSYEEVCT